MFEPHRVLDRPKSVPALPRLGFAGAGWIGLNRMKAMQEAEACEVTAIFDPAADACARASAEAPAAQVVPRFADLLQLPLDGIVIATPSALHAAQAITALSRGMAVFCQKPLGRNARETRNVISAARSANRLLQVDLSYRFQRGMQVIRDLIQRGELGHVYAVEAVFHNAYGPDKPWFFDPQLSGGGCLLDLGIHLVDLALWCLDFPVVTAATGQLLARGRPLPVPAREVEDYAAAQLRLANGTSVQLTCSWRAHAGCDARIELTFLGTEGGASFTNVGGSFYDFRADHLRPNRTRASLAEPPDGWGGRAAVAWAQQLGASRDYDPAIETLSLVAETLDRIYART